MNRRTHYNPQGEIIMGAAAYHAQIHGIPELAERTGIPYTTLHKRVGTRGGFGGMSMDQLRAIVRVAGMTDEEIISVVRLKK